MAPSSRVGGGPCENAPASTKEVARGGPGRDRRLRGLGVLLAARGRPRGEDRHARTARRRTAFFLATVAGRRVAFLPRHGRRHTIPPHRVNYRANVWAMRSLGVKAVISPCAAGSLQLHVEPGHFVVSDQFVDRTSGRADTFFDGPIVSHVSSAEIYDPTLRGIALDVIREHGITVHDGGTVVVIQGPRFSTKAESEVVQRRRVGGHQHDPVPGGLPVPRAGDGRRQHRADHGLRRGRARGNARGDRARRARGVRAERRADPQGRAGHGRAASRPTSTRWAPARRCGTRGATATPPAPPTSASSRRGSSRACR